MFFPAKPALTLTGYCDSDWGGCTTTGRSVTGYCIFLGQALISWQAKKQTVTSISSAEAEYRALATITTEIMWLKYLLSDLQIPTTVVVPVFCDNQAAIDIATNPVQHARTKHIELDCHFVREKVHMGVISPLKISTKLQLADIFIKNLGGVAHWYICSKLGLHNPCVITTCGGRNTSITSSSEDDKSNKSEAVCAYAGVQKSQYKRSIYLAVKSQVNDMLTNSVWS